MQGTDVGTEASGVLSFLVENEWFLCENLHHKHTTESLFMWRKPLKSSIRKGIFEAFKPKCSANDGGNPP